MTERRRTVIARAGALVVTVAVIGALTVGASGTRADVTDDRDRVLAATCVSALERAGRADEALADRPDIGMAQSYAADRRSQQAESRRPSSVGVFRDRCRPTARSEQLSVLFERLSSRTR